MRRFPPNKFAAWLAVVMLIILIPLQWSGLQMTAGSTTNLMIAWGIVSVCHAIEWHARQR